MLPSTFEDIFLESDCILGEGALIERLRRNSPFELDPFIVNSGFIYEEPKRKAIETIYRDYLRAFPGVKEGLEALTEQNKRLAIVTSRKINSLTIFLKETGIFDFFEIMITPDETDKHKPEPEPALKAISLLGAEKEKSLFIGDSLFDIQCGARAGIDTAFVTYSKNDSKTFDTRPTWLIDSLEALCVSG